MIKITDSNVEVFILGLRIVIKTTELENPSSILWRSILPAIQKKLTLVKIMKINRRQQLIPIQNQQLTPIAILQNLAILEVQMADQLVKCHIDILATREILANYFWLRRHFKPDVGLKIMI